MSFKEFYEDFKIPVIKLAGFGNSRHDNEPIWDIIKYFEEIGFENPTNPDEIIVDGVRLDLQVLKGKLYIKFIGATRKGRGNGTFVMKQIIDEADENDVDIILYPTSVGDTTKEQLIKWYKSLGFEEKDDSMVYYS